MLFGVAMTMTGIGIISMVGFVVISIMWRHQEKRLMRERIVSVQQALWRHHKK